MFNLIPWRKKEEDGGQLAARRAGDPFTLMRDEFETMFNRFFRNFSTPLADWGIFPGWEMDWEDTGKEFIVQAEAPGFEAGDFDVQVTGNWLTIRADHKQQGKTDKEQQYIQRRFQRSFTLPPGADPDKIEARYHSGILELRFPKLPEAVGMRIEVKS
jgi:HSP20 family protein